MSKLITMNEKRLARMARLQREYISLYGLSKGLIGLSSEYIQITDSFFAENFGTDMPGELTPHDNVELSTVHEGVTYLALFSPDYPGLKIGGAL
jgi:hypothetical protein